MFNSKELSDIVNKTAQKVRGLLSTATEATKNIYIDFTTAFQEASYVPPSRLRNASTLSAAALAFAAALYFAKPVKAERLLSEFYSPSSLVTGEKFDLVGPRMGLLAEAGAYSDDALARGIRTEGYNFIRTEAQSKYLLLRLNFTDFPGTDGVETREAFLGLRLETKPFSGSIGVK